MNKQRKKNHIPVNGTIKYFITTPNIQEYQDLNGVEDILNNENWKKTMRIGKRQYNKESPKRVRLNFDDNLIFDCKPEKEDLLILGNMQQLDVINKSVVIRPKRHCEIIAAELIDHSDQIINMRLFPRTIIIGKDDTMEITFVLHITGPISKE